MDVPPGSSSMDVPPGSSSMDVRVPPGSSSMDVRVPPGSSSMDVRVPPGSSSVDVGELLAKLCPGFRPTDPIPSIIAAMPLGTSMTDVLDLLAELCPGYKFRPTDSEIVAYLKREIESRIHPFIWRVHRVVFLNYMPQELAEKYQAAQDNKWYFLSSSPLNANETKPGWKLTHGHTLTERRVYNEADGQLVGYRLKYEFLDENHHKTEWLMCIYYVEDPNCETNKLSPWMLCKMYKDNDDVEEGRWEWVEEEEEEEGEYASSSDDGKEKCDQGT